MAQKLSFSIIVALFALMAVVSAAKTPNMLRGRKIERIAGGELATIAEFPYIVDVMAGGAIGYIHYCNGIILTPEWILTTGSCAQLPLYYYVIFSGDHDAESTVQRTYLHPNYDENTMLGDIGLLHLTDALIFGDTVQAAVLPQKAFVPTGNVTIAAWDSASRLYQANLPLVSNDECNRLYENSTRFSITDSMLCAGELGRGPCEDDYGGPVVCENDGEHVLCGTLSWRGNGCPSEEGLPGVANRISEYLDWIEATIN